MIETLRRDLPEGCISDLRFDQWRAGELDPELIEELEGHLESCARCQARHDEIEAQAEAFLAAYPKLELPQPEAPRADDGNVVALRAKRARLYAWSGGLVGLAAAAAFALVVGTKGAGDGDELGVRSKGTSRIGFFVKHGEHVREGGDGQVVYPGDQLRFYITSLKPQHVAILSLDGAGAASIYYPAGGTSESVGVLRNHAVDSSVLLDDALGEERLWGIFCEAPFELEPLREALEQNAALPALTGCTVDELSMVKQKAKQAAP